MLTALKHRDTSTFCRTRHLRGLLGCTIVCTCMCAHTWLKLRPLFQAESSPYHVPTFKDIIALIRVMELSFYTEVAFTSPLCQCFSASFPHGLSPLILSTHNIFIITTLVLIWIVRRQKCQPTLNTKILYSVVFCFFLLFTDDASFIQKSSTLHNHITCQQIE